MTTRPSSVLAARNQSRDQLVRPPVASLLSILPALLHDLTSSSNPPSSTTFIPLSTITLALYPSTSSSLSISLFPSKLQADTSAPGGASSSSPVEVTVR